MKKTFKELIEINNVYNNITIINPKIINTKFGYAFNRFHKKNLEKPFEEYNLAMSMVRVDSALTDKVTGELMTDPTNTRGYKYDKAGQKAVMTAEAALTGEWAAKDFEVEPFIAEAPTDFNEYEKEVFEGTLINNVKSNAATDVVAGPKK